jgi:hypothetical protein
VALKELCQTVEGQGGSSRGVRMFRQIRPIVKVMSRVEHRTRVIERERGGFFEDKWAMIHLGVVSSLFCIYKYAI